MQFIPPQKVTVVCHFLNPLGSSLSSALFLRFLLWPAVPPAVSAPCNRQVAVLHYFPYTVSKTLY